MQGEKNQALAGSEDKAIKSAQWAKCNTGAFLLLNAMAHLSDQTIPVKRKIKLTLVDAKKLHLYNQEIESLAKQIADATLKFKPHEGYIGSEIISQYLQNLQGERDNRECDRDAILQNYLHVPDDPYRAFEAQSYLSKLQRFQQLSQERQEEAKNLQAKFSLDKDDAQEVYRQMLELQEQARGFEYEAKLLQEGAKNAYQEAKELQDMVNEALREAIPYVSYLPSVSQGELDKRKSVVMEKANKALWHSDALLDYRDDDIDWSKIRIELAPQSAGSVGFGLDDFYEPEFIDDEPEIDGEEPQPLEPERPRRIKRTVSYSESDWTKFKLTGRPLGSTEEASNETTDNTAQTTLSL